MLMKYQIRFVLDVPNQVYAKSFLTKEDRDAFFTAAVDAVFNSGLPMFSFKQDIPENAPILDAEISILSKRIIAIESTDVKTSG